MKRHANRQGFTLVELVFSCTIGVIVLGAMMTLLVQSFVIWRDGTSWMYLTVQSRLAREKILRGLEGQYGLRQASSKSFAISQGLNNRDTLTFNVDTNIWPTTATTDDRSYVVSTDNDRRLWADCPSIMMSLLRPDLQTEVLDLSSSGKLVKATLVMTLHAGGQTYTNQQSIQTYLVNE